MELGGPQRQSERLGEENNFFPLRGFEPRTVQPVASRYTDYTTPDHRDKYNQPCDWLF
jgi:hypothetical protein